ncbi:murein biosynthesis integral membrane protein MurJ [uncultured Sphaerochaeta sp.]|uniref:murein biosynthesis integral membrane protein MurJ n=1 Tax=uncultured Sphaerochaeta sp. TaxID=886478 RepID=UPI002A0A4ED9|nr:murein biosynthesis integral membrane protein MurJ [uncultured Sphaerochaeta sp.]
MQDSTQSSKTAKSSFAIMLCTIASRLLGIVKARVLSSVFGASGVADVINFTFNIPNNFRKLFAEGAVNSALIPAFSSLLGLGKKRSSLHLFSLLCTYQAILLIPLVLLSYFFGEEFISLISDFDSAQVALGAKLLPFFMVYLAAISMGAIFNGVLQSHHNFLHAYLSPLLFSLSVIFGVQYLTPYLGAMSMAWATLVGGLLQGSYSYLMLRRYGYRLKPAIRQADTPLKPVIGAWSLVVLGMGMQVLTQLVTYHFASTLSEGSVTAFANATIFYQTPYGVFFNAISAVSLPLLSRSYALGQMQEMQKHTRLSIVQLTSLLLPSGIILFFLSQESVSVVLQTGNYTLADAQLTALALRPFLLFMVTTSWYAMLLRLGYSANRYALMTKITFLQNFVDIILMWVFITLGWGIISLPLANGISYVVLLGFLSFKLRDLYNPIKDTRLRRGLLRTVAANIPILGYCLLYASFGMTWYQSGSNLRNFLILSLLALGSLVVWLLSYALLKVELLSLFRSKKQGSNL